MKQLREVIGRELCWRRLSLFSRRYELTAGDDILAEILWEGIWSRSCTIRTADGSWTARRVLRLFTREVRITDSTGASVATYSGRFRTGDLRFESGENFSITGGLMNSSVRVQNTNGSLVVTQTWKWPHFRRAANVEIAPAGAADPRLGLVIAFAFELMVERRRAAAAASSG